MRARQVIINTMIETYRNEVIKFDIEYNYLLRLQQKGSDASALYQSVFGEPPEHAIIFAKQRYDISLDKLNYLKELKDHSRADRIQAIVEKNSADIISATVMQS